MVVYSHNVFITDCVIFPSIIKLLSTFSFCCAVVVHVWIEWFSQDVQLTCMKE